MKTPIARPWAPGRGSSGIGSGLAANRKRGLSGDHLRCRGMQGRSSLDFAVLECQLARLSAERTPAPHCFTDAQIDLELHKFGRPSRVPIEPTSPCNNPCLLPSSQLPIAVIQAHQELPQPSMLGLIFPLRPTDTNQEPRWISRNSLYHRF